MPGRNLNEVFPFRPIWLTHQSGIIRKSGRIFLALTGMAFIIEFESIIWSGKAGVRLSTAMFGYVANVPSSR